MNTDAAKPAGEDGTARAAPAAPSLLGRFLATSDVPCPACGYNLRGAVGDRCPECAQPLSLSVARPDPAAALTWFLLLAFGWVFAAGVMNSVRNAGTIRGYVANARTWGYSGAPGRLSIFQQGRGLVGATASPVQPTSDGGFWATAWDIVPAMSWIGAAWALTLAIGCGIGLVLLARRRARPFTATGDRRMVAFACTLFSIYATWHVMTFILEFM